MQARSFFREQATWASPLISRWREVESVFSDDEPKVDPI